MIARRQLAKKTKGLAKGRDERLDSGYYIPPIPPLGQQPGQKLHPYFREDADKLPSDLMATPRKVRPRLRIN